MVVVDVRGVAQWAAAGKDVRIPVLVAMGNERQRLEEDRVRRSVQKIGFVDVVRFPVSGRSLTRRGFVPRSSSSPFASPTFAPLWTALCGTSVSFFSSSPLLWEASHGALA
jgi:hypothetical protein